MRLTIIAMMLITSVICFSCNSSKSIVPAKQHVSNSRESLLTNHNVQSEQPIHMVDFKNFTFPLCPSVKREILLKAESITLNNGKLEVPRDALGNEDPIDFSLSNVSYRELTGDDNEEAIVILTHFLYPQGSSTCTFVYTWRANTSQVIWQHESGNAAFGGLRRLSVDNSRLIIEEYMPTGSGGDCCPEQFTQSTYIWNGKQFAKIKSRVFSNESKEANFLGFP